MEIVILVAILVFIFGQNKTHRRVRGRRLSDEIHPAFTILESLIP